MKYARFHLLTLPARDNCAVWQTALGFMMALALMFGLTQGVFVALNTLMAPDSYQRFATAVDRADTPFGLLMLLGLMGAMGLGAFTVVDVVHKRAPATIVGPWPLARRQFWDVLAMLFALQVVVMILPPWGMWDSSAPGLAPGRWVALLPLTLVMIFVQAGSEELMFRGYLQSQLGARFRQSWVWIGVPSVVFGLMHYMPGLYGSAAWAVVLWAVIFGMACADLTARAGTLGPAVALHMVNNFMAIGLFAQAGEMSGLALRVVPFTPGDGAGIMASLPVELAMVGVSWLAARLALRS